MSPGEEALMAFQKTNPDHYKRFSNSSSWLIIYLANRFPLELRLRETQNISLKEAQGWILEKLVRHFESTERGFCNNEERQIAAFSFEGCLIWFLEYERDISAYGELSRERKKLWQQMRYVFELDTSIEDDQNEDENIEDENTEDENTEDDENEYEEENAENDEDGGTAPDPRADLKHPNESTSQAASSLQCRIRRNIDKAKVFEEIQMQFPSMALPNIGPVNRQEILDSLITKAQQELPRFNQLFEEVDEASIKNRLERNLNPMMRTMCEKGLFDIEHIRELSQGLPDPATLQQSGIYLHILWLKANPNIFWLYIGQSICMKDRIRDHINRRHTKNHFCLHYHIWNTSEEKDSLFVSLYTAPSHSSQQLVLNLAEMWMCCVFQTLTPLHLNDYLPENVNKIWVGRHLNVALPLWQSFSDSPENKTEHIGGRDAFEEFLQSPNPEVRQWAKSLRDGFNQLRNSPDSRLRSYHQQHKRISLQLAAAGCQNATIQRLQGFLSGKEATVNVTIWKRDTSPGPLYGVRCGMFTFTISQEFGLSFENKEKVILQLHLSETEHPMKFASRALKTDPASRLAVSISGLNSNDTFVVWLETKGERAVFKMNTLVDILEGYTHEERETFLRRWISKRDASGRGGRNKYT